MMNWKTRVFECDRIEDGEGSVASMKVSISEMVSLGQGGDKIVGVKVFLVEDCKEEVVVVKDQ